MDRSDREPRSGEFQTMMLFTVRAHRRRHRRNPRNIIADACWASPAKSGSTRTSVQQDPELKGR